MAWLLGIRDAASIQTHAARGALFETPQGMQAMEVKSGSTFASDWPDAILKWQKFESDAALPPVIVYGGEGDYERQGCRVVGAARAWSVDGCKAFRAVAPVECA